MDYKNILIAMDSFKGSLTSMQAGNAVKEGILRVWPMANVTVCPLADGGEGTVRAIVDGIGGELVSVQVTGPLGEAVACEYGIVRFEKDKDACCAIIEIAGAAGLPLVPQEKRNPMYTTTYGVGEVIRDAVGRGCRRFIIGIGGSATNDGGVGMLQALGVHFLDENGNEIERGAAGLETLNRIDPSGIMKELSECEFRIACDVENPLCGENGCSAVFAPQKGAEKTDIARMDRWLSHYAQMAARLSQEDSERKKRFVESDLIAKQPKSVSAKKDIGSSIESVEEAELTMTHVDADYPGDGAAGGLGFAFRTFLHGELVSGSKLIIEETGLIKYMEKADMVITGEGCLDGQTIMGKAPICVARLAKACGRKGKVKQVIAFAGKLGEGAEACLEHGIDSYFEIDRGTASMEEAMKPEVASGNLTDTVEKLCRRKDIWRIK